MAELMMYEEMRAYMRMRGGKWDWGFCDCIGLLLHLSRVSTGRAYRRGDYIDESMTYRQALTWLSMLTDPMRPYVDLLERDAGFEHIDPGLQGRWDVAIVSTEQPLILPDRSTVYPTNTAPGVIFFPPELDEPCVMHRRGFSPVSLPPANVSRSKHYRLFGES